MGGNRAMSEKAVLRPLWEGLILWPKWAVLEQDSIKSIMLWVGANGHTISSLHSKSSSNQMQNVTDSRMADGVELDLTRASVGGSRSRGFEVQTMADVEGGGDSGII